MKASLIISAYNEGALLARTVETCIETSAGLDQEILIADDGSTDGSVDDVVRRFTPVRSVRHEHRRGVSPTKMLGAQHARGDVLVFLDGHCNPERGAIARLVERVAGLTEDAVLTPTVAALDPVRWRNDPNQVGHGYTVDLFTLECGWQPLSALRPAGEDAPGLYESPAFIGCSFAISRSLFDRLWGFDPHMLSWGVEDIDLALKCWLMGHRVLHEPAAVIGHRFRAEFEGYPVPADHVAFNELRLARKAFTDGVWNQWVSARRDREPDGRSAVPEGVWARAWHRYENGRDTVEPERSYLLGHRTRDEFWYADRFGLDWPRLGEQPMALPTITVGSPSPHPSRGPSGPPPTPTVEIQVNNTPTTTDDLVPVQCAHPPARTMVNCQIRLTSTATSPVTVVLTDPSGRLRFPTATTVTLTLPVSKAFVPFQISGQSASAAIGDATIQAHVGSAGGALAGSRPVTVVSFGAAQIKLTQGGNYALVGNVYSVPGGVAVTFDSQAAIRPVGTNCAAPQLANVRIGIMQESSNFVITETWNTPSVAFLASAPVGTTVTVPTTTRETTTYAATVHQPVNDGLDGASPLYSMDATALTRPMGCPSGAVATSNDTPGQPAPPTFSMPVTSGGVVVGTATWSNRVNTTRTEHFRTYCVTFDTGTKKFCALRQATWDINLNSALANQHATVTADAVASANPATGVQANHAPTTTTNAGVGTATTTFTKH